jgi:hypothetical protein
MVAAAERIRDGGDFSLLHNASRVNQLFGG